MTRRLFRSITERYLANHDRFLAPNTVRNYRQSFERLCEYSKKQKREINAETISLWSQSMMQEKRHVNTIIMHRGIIEAAFRWAVENKLAEENPVKPIRTLTPQPSHRINFTTEEYAKLQTYDWPERFAFLQWTVVVCWETGLRISDVAALKWTGIFLDENVMRLKTVKTKQDLEIPITPALETALRNCQVWATDAEKHVFPMLAYMFMVGDASYRRALRRACRAVGIPNNKSWHSMRHGLVTRLLTKGVPAAVVGSITGQSLQTLSRYSHPSLEQKRAALIQTTA